MENLNKEIEIFKQHSASKLEALVDKHDEPKTAIQIKNNLRIEASVSACIFKITIFPFTFPHAKSK